MSHDSSVFARISGCALDSHSLHNATSANTMVRVTAVLLLSNLKVSFRIAVRIWLITIGEPVPVSDGSNDRLHRTGYLSHLLADKGHDVIWWTWTFGHFRKVHRFGQDTIVLPKSLLEIRLLNGCGYHTNLSFQRILDHRNIASNFSDTSRSLPPPDLVFCSFPTIELSLAATLYGKERCVPVVLDMWATFSSMKYLNHSEACAFGGNTELLVFSPQLPHFSCIRNEHV